MLVAIKPLHADADADADADVSQSAIPDESMRAPLAQAGDKRRVTLELRINSTHALAIQRLLRKALTDEARILTVSVDYKRNRTCFHISAGRGSMAGVMDAVVSALPEAELGIVRSLH